MQIDARRLTTAVSKITCVVMVLDTLWKRLRYARECRGLKGRELARLAELKSESHPSLIEGERGGISADVAAKLAHALNVPLDWLVNGGEIPESLSAADHPSRGAA
jgi:transcriptional regulator with XRE-family HTH domain